jgi:hypothetical protein
MTVDRRQPPCRSPVTLSTPTPGPATGSQAPSTSTPSPHHPRPRVSAPPASTSPPGARTAWHTHRYGQTIYVTEGIGLCQRGGGPIEVIRPGDRVYFEPGEDHWHGAALTAS